MILSEKPIEEIKVGDRVKSLATGHLGTVSIVEDQLQHPDSPRDIDNDYWVTIAWDCGKTSVTSHLWLDKVQDLTELEATKERVKQVSTHGLFHTLWSKAVGQENYDKSEWTELGDRIGDLLDPNEKRYFVNSRSIHADN
jgi:hypothetical protein